MKFLEIGPSNIRAPDWGTFNQDVTDGLPYQDNTYDGIYCPHTIQKLYKYQTIKFLREIKRILKPGGVVRISWSPYDLVEALIVDQDLSNDTFIKGFYDKYLSKYNIIPANGKNKRIQEQVALALLHNGGANKYLFGVNELMQTNKDVEFSSTYTVPYGYSNFLQFNGLEPPDIITKYHTMVVEAVK